jgi:predicted ATP-grasp superfamily ATP-dependent carboligase
LANKQGTINNILTFYSDLFRIIAESNIFSIQCLIDGVYGDILRIQHNNGISRISILGELRPTSINGLNSLDIVDTLTASSVIASNLYTKIETDALLAHVSSNSNDLDSKQDIITPTTPLSCGPLTVLGP